MSETQGRNYVNNAPEEEEKFQSFEKEPDYDCIVQVGEDLGADRIEIDCVPGQVIFDWEFKLTNTGRDAWPSTTMLCID